MGFKPLSFTPIRSQANLIPTPHTGNTGQEHENEIAEVVIVCEPEQASLMMGGLHPRGSLYERPVNIDTAKQQHAEFRKARSCTWESLGQ